VERLPRLALVIVTLVGPCACKSGPAEPSPSTSSGATDAGAATPATARSPLATGRVTAKNCEEWAEHGSSVFVATMTNAAAACPPQARDEIRQRFAAELVAIRSGANTLCTGHLAQAYSLDAASCFMNASDALVMRACRFEPMTNPGDSDWESILDQTRQRCAAASGGTPPPASSNTPL
jgi:hypothetical protein